jgi:hypothetical protein
VVTSRLVSPANTLYMVLFPVTWLKLQPILILFTTWPVLLAQQGPRCHDVLISPPASVLTGPNILWHSVVNQSDFTNPPLRIIFLEKLTLFQVWAGHHTFMGRKSPLPLRSEAVTAPSVKMSVFWDVAVRSLVGSATFQTCLPPLSSGWWWWWWWRQYTSLKRR